MMEPKSAIERVGISSEELENLQVNETDRKTMHAIHPIEGRYSRYVSDLSNIFSDFEWQRRRIWVEVEYLIALAEFLNNNSTEKRKILTKEFTEDEKKVMRQLYENLKDKDYIQIVHIDKKIHHDVVAVVRWVSWRLQEAGINVDAAVHFGRTSADINTNVFNSMVRDAFYKQYMPKLIELSGILINNAKNMDVVFAGQTHGQFAEMTTLKKVYANFVDALRQAMEDFENVEFVMKLGGAVGNNSDIIGAYPDLDWEAFNNKFANSLGLKYYPMADQDEFNIQLAKVLDTITRVNDVLIKVSSDFWDYASRGIFRKKTSAEESGSSVMAQKTNPWRAESAWEYLEDVDLSKYRNLIKYKRQGDLRRSIRKRTMGEPFAKIIIAMNRLIDELNRYEPNKEVIENEINSNIGMASAYIQTVLRREGKEDAYDIIKKASMGKNVQIEDYHRILDNMADAGEITKDVSEEIKEGMKPENNIGCANKLADDAIAKAEELILRLVKGNNKLRNDNYEKSNISEKDNDNNMDCAEKENNEASMQKNIKNSAEKKISYADAGVDIDLGDEASKILYNAAKETWQLRKGRIGEIIVPFDDFSGLRMIDVGKLPQGTMLCLGFDGVGTKIEIAERVNDYSTVAFDLLAMVCDDASVRGGEPVIVGSIMDVNSLGRGDDIHIEKIIQLAEGYMQAAKDANVAIINGELAEMGDRVGGYGNFNANWGSGLVWLANKSRMLTGSEIKEGDSIVSFQEQGFRSNGLSLVRAVFKQAHGEEWHNVEFQGSTLGKLALTPSKIYCKTIADINGGVIGEAKAIIHGVSHITGGGIPGKLGRVLKPSKLGAELDNIYEPPEIMKECQRLGNVGDVEAYKTWNMGNGMLVITPEPEKVIEIAAKNGVKAKVAGKVVAGGEIKIKNHGIQKSRESLVF